MAIETKDNIVLIAPPTVLTILPVVATIGAIWYYKKKGKSWFDTLLIGGAVAVVSSIPTMIFAYNINKQYIKQTEVKTITK